MYAHVIHSITLTKMPLLDASCTCYLNLAPLPVVATGGIVTRTIVTPQCVVAKRPNGTAYAAQGFMWL